MNRQSIKILFVEDNEDDYVAVRKMLAIVQEPQFEVEWAATYEEALSSLTRSSYDSQDVSASYDACLLNYYLGEHTGLDVLQQALSYGPQPPMILLTGVANRDVDLQAMEMGASNFLIKDEISPATLERAIRYAIRHKQAETLLNQSQEALAQTNATLESKVAEQTAELEQTREQEAYLRQLQARLLASVSHEFRTPLMTIQGAAEMIEEGSSDEDTQSQRLQRIYAGVNRITRTLDNALIYAALEAGSIPFQPVPVDLVAVCEELVANLQQLATPQQQLQFINSSHLATRVPVDINLVQLMLTHLMLNAICYAPNSHRIQLELICEQQGTVVKTLVFRITDEGIGIPSDEIEKVFAGYYRASNANLIPGTPGIGLGLAIVKRAVELHGGQVSLSSEVGVGTTAELILPVG